MTTVPPAARSAAARAAALPSTRPPVLPQVASPPVSTREGLPTFGRTPAVTREEVAALSAQHAGAAARVADGLGDASREVRVVGHRGSWKGPENTLAAYRIALQDGAKLLECDVHLSSDGVPIVIHDDTLARTTGQPGVVSDYTREQLQSFDAGSWKAPAFAGEKLPTLAELLALVKDQAALAIELKAPGMAAAVVRAIHDSGVAPEALTAFAWTLDELKEVRALEPRLPLTYLVEDPPKTRATQAALIASAAAAGVDTLGVELTPQVDAAFVKRAHEGGVQVFVWTVNEEADMRRLIAAGVDGLISDKPELAARVVGEARPG